MREPILLFVCVGAAACGGGESSVASSPLSEVERAEVCGELCDHQGDCGVPEPVCLGWCGEIAGLIRADAARALVDCYVGLVCDDTTQRCLAEVTNATEPTVAYHQARDACEAAASRCHVWYGCDLTYVVLLADQTLDALGDCFTLDCATVDVCLDGVLGS